MALCNLLHDLRFKVDHLQKSLNFAQRNLEVEKNRRVDLEETNNKLMKSNALSTAQLKIDSAIMEALQVNQQKQVRMAVLHFNAYYELGEASISQQELY